LRREQPASQRPSGVPAGSQPKAAAPRLHVTTGRRATRSGDEPRGQVWAHSRQSAIPDVDLRRRRVESTQSYAHIVPLKDWTTSAVVALSSHSHERAQKKGGEYAGVSRERWVPLCRSATPGCSPPPPPPPPPSTPCCLLRFLYFPHKAAALTCGLQRRPPYFSPPQQEDNHLAIATARATLERLQATRTVRTEKAGKT